MLTVVCDVTCAVVTVKAAWRLTGRDDDARRHSGGDGVAARERHQRIAGRRSGGQRHRAGREATPATLLGLSVTEERALAGVPLTVIVAVWLHARTSP